MSYQKEGLLDPRVQSMIHSWDFFEMDFTLESDFSNTSSNVPNGFIELVFLKDLQIYEKERNKQIKQLPAAFVWGQTKWGSHLITLGRGRWFEVKLHPWAFHLLFDHPAGSLPSGSTPLEALHKDYERLSEEINGAASPQEALRKFETFALQQIQKASPLQTFLIHAYQMIYNSYGNLPITNLCQHLQVSRQYLHQSFKEKIGLSPKAYAKIIRLRHAVDRIYTEPDKTLTQTSLEAGYFDQAHFINDFKSILGQSPKSFFKQKQFIFWDL